MVTTRKTIRARPLMFNVPWHRCCAILSFSFKASVLPRKKARKPKLLIYNDGKNDESVNGTRILVYIRAVAVPSVSI